MSVLTFAHFATDPSTAVPPWGYVNSSVVAIDYNMSLLDFPVSTPYVDMPNLDPLSGAGRVAADTDIFIPTGDR